ncbi:BBP7 family outer membrane beta-barrel protein [Pirellulales bacterium]|nr:BBP7 family outer membrane beta-barrel protein [Pirellulales bacterium]
MKSLFARCLTPTISACVLIHLAATAQGQVANAVAYGPTGGAQQAPAMPASPLAGGMTAMDGSGYIDAHGNPVVVPAQYMADGGYCPPAAGYGDGMYADFGGFGVDQCGPHYFDVALDAVTLQDEDRFEGVGPLGSVGVGANAPRVLDPANGATNYEVGWQITARLDFGPLSVLEATYMGIYDFGFTESVRSVDVTNPSQDFQLFSAFSNFGLGTLIPGLDDGRSYTTQDNADLQSTEFTYRRYWVGSRPRISGTMLAGFRYIRYTDEFILQSVGLVDPVNVGSVTRSWDGTNDLLGGQIGGDMSICLRQGLRVNIETKAGVYNNRYEFRHVGDFADGFTGSPADFDSTTIGNQVSFAGEGKAEVVFDILPSLSLRGGYRVLYMSSLATPGDNIVTADITDTTVRTQSDALFHGFHGGLEFVY